MLKQQFSMTSKDIGYLVLDDLLPEELISEIYNAFPKPEEATEKKNLREQKFVGYQMDQYHPVLEEIIYAFQEDCVVSLISEICEIESLFPDEFLYAGGISLMTQGGFLNPHLDNSYDKDRNLWRALNLLYYASPDWELEDGGNLELWNNGVKEEQTVIESRCNRLIVMATHQKSWHSVNKVLSDKTRCCVSNYYFSETPLKVSDTFHVTTFRGRPKERVKDFVLQLDSKLRTIVRKIFKNGVQKKPHQYQK
ncbi:MAG: 2OG-Fe(II) oxygenase [Flavobacteriaceae bacterium]|nr:2OG-Fe(II) oxygenase [Flavobacteriaceae bacterium]